MPKASLRRALLAQLAVVLAAAAAVITFAAPANATIPPPDGGGGGQTYNFKFGTGLCLDDPGGTTVNGTQLDQKPCDYGTSANAQAQKWYLVPLSTSTGGVELWNAASGKCANRWGGGTVNGTAIKIYNCGSSNEAFNIWPQGSNTFIAVDGSSLDQVMSVSGSSTASGAKITTWRAYTNNSQLVTCTPNSCA